MSEGVVFSCGPQEPGGGPGRPIARRGGRSAVIDIHCHLSIPAADALMRGRESPVAISINSFSSPASDEVNRRQFAQIGRKLSSIDDRIADMDALGVDIQAISPSPGQYYYWAEPGLGLEAARLVNDGMAEAVARHPDRLVGMGTVPLQSPELAVQELKRLTGELGLRGVEISSNVDGRELADPEFRPFFAAAEALGVLVFMHPLGFTHGQRLSEHYFNNLIGNPLESTIAVGHLIFGGVLDAHPGLKLCVAHGGGYLPGYIGRMDHAFRAREDCRQHIHREPSSYLRQLYFDTLVFDRGQLENLVRTYGADRLMMGTDYPFDMSEPDPIGFHAALSEADRENILGGTAARLLGLTSPAQGPR
jgi:aminocarboxymuconate-semialdehyde decarboxylase